MMDIKKLMRLEQQYELEQFPNDREFELIAGNCPVLISAPHSVTHFREGKTKFGEFMTAPLAIALHEAIDCAYITKQKNNLTDPNFDAVHPYKQEIIQFVTANDIRFMLDLHIMSSKRVPNIEIGTGKGQNIFGQTKLIQLLIEAFEAETLEPIIVDELFTGGNPNTVSSTVAKATQIPCIQIEINWRLLDHKSEQQKVKQVIHALQRFIKQALLFEA